MAYRTYLCASCPNCGAPLDDPDDAPATEPSGERDGLRKAAQRLCDAYADKAAVDGLTQSGHITDWHESAKADDAFLCALQDTRTALDGRERPHRHVPARAALDTGEDTE